MWWGGVGNPCTSGRCYPSDVRFLLFFVVVFTRQLGLPQQTEQVFLPSVLSVLFYVLEFWLVTAAHSSFNSSGRDTGSFNWDYVSPVL